MDYYIGIDTADLNDTCSKGVLVVYTKIDDVYQIIRSYEDTDSKSFYKIVAEVKQFYQPNEILEWN